jgi:hypothetical protein
MNKFFGPLIVIFYGLLYILGAVVLILKGVLK